MILQNRNLKTSFSLGQFSFPCQKKTKDLYVGRVVCDLEFVKNMTQSMLCIKGSGNKGSKILYYSSQTLEIKSYF